MKKINLHRILCIFQLFSIVVIQFLCFNALAQCPDPAPTCYQNCTLPDLDNDGVPDSQDLDDDNDGILDTDEGFTQNTMIDFAQSLIPNGDFNNNYVDVNNPGTPYTNADGNFVPPPWGQSSTPDLSVDSEISFNNNGDPRASLNGFDSSPAGGSFMGFRSNEGIYNTLQIMDADDEITVQFYYTEYEDNQSNPGPPNPGVNIEFRINSTSPNSGVTVLDVPNLAQTGGTEGTWELRTLTFVPSDYGIPDNSNPNFLLGAVGSVSGNWAFVDGLVVVVTNTTITTTDTDGDGIDDHRDLDSDNDGIPDAIEACGNIGLNLESCRLDSDGNSSYNTDANGCSNGVLLTAFCIGSPLDSDTNGTPDFLQLDSDGDGCADAIEGCTFYNATVNILTFDNPAAPVSADGLTLFASTTNPYCPDISSINYQSASLEGGSLSISVCPASQYGVNCTEDLEILPTTIPEFIAAGGNYDHNCYADANVVYSASDSIPSDCTNDSYTVYRTHVLSDICNNIDSCTQIFIYERKVPSLDASVLNCQ